jgi:hypothetical protein
MVELFPDFRLRRRWSTVETGLVLRFSILSFSFGFDVRELFVRLLNLDELVLGIFFVCLVLETVRVPLARQLSVRRRDVFLRG